MREIARRFNERFGEILVEPDARIPEIGARIMDLQEPANKMSTTTGTEQGTVLVLDDAKTVTKKIKSAVTDSGSEVKKGEGKEGIANLIDILAVARGSTPEEIEKEFEGSGYGDFKGAVAEAVVDFLAPVRERYEELRPDEAELERTLAAGRRKGAGDRLGDPRRRPHGDRGRPARLGIWPASSASLSSVHRVTSVAQLDLDLDIFQGPFDLLLAVVLREEISLADVSLGDIVVAYIEHLEGRGRVGPRRRDRVPGLDRGPARAQVARAAAHEDEDDEFGPEEAADELLARMLEYRRYRDAAMAMEKMFTAELPYIYRAAPLPKEIKRAALKAAKPVYEPDSLGRALGDLLTPPPEPRTDHIRPTVSLHRRLGVLREALAKLPRFDFEDTFGAEDRLTQAVTLFALLEMHRRGEATWSQKDSFGPIEVLKT